MHNRLSGRKRNYARGGILTQTRNPSVSELSERERERERERARERESEREREREHHFIPTSQVHHDYFNVPYNYLKATSR